MAIDNIILTFGGNKIGTVGGNKLMGYEKPFLPTDISNNILWLNNDPSTMTLDGSNKVGQWNDLSGLNHHFTQSTGANKPLFVSAGINGQNGVYFSNSADNFLNCVFSTTYSQPFTIFTVWNLDSSSTQSFPTAYCRSVTTTDRVTLMWRSSQIRIFSPNAADAYAKTRPFSLMSNCVEYNNTSTKVYENNVLKNTISTGTAILQDMRIGNQGGTTSASYRISGYICEQIIYSRALTTDERTLVSDYLTLKYGL